MNKKNFLNYAIIFLLIYLVMGMFFGPTQDDQTETGGNFQITATKKEYKVNDLIAVKIKNNTGFKAVIKNECPEEPLNVSLKNNGQWESISHSADLDCSGTKDKEIDPGKEITIDYRSWNHSLFGKTGTYKITTNITVPDDNSLNTSLESNEFTLKPQGGLGFVWSNIFYRPIYNILIFFASTIPFHDFGLAIILLTILIRTILLIPSHKSMKSQRKMQEIQPKLNHIKEKHKGNQEMISKETMAIWKDHKVNPLSGCLPLLIQFPILIAIFYVIQNGLNPDNTYLLYGSLKDFSIRNINTNFLGILELKNINHFVLPIIVGGLQFTQMKLAMMRKKDKNDDKKENKQNEMEMANQMMIYIMPVMIAVFTASMPAGVGLYWSVSTAYGIAQQYVVNKQLENEKASVKVIKK